MLELLTRDRIVGRDLAEVRRQHGITLVTGHARFTGPRSVEVDGPGAQRLRATNVVIATGSRARRPSIRGLASDRLVTTDELFDLDMPPGAMAILGGGAVGVEMAAAFARLGTRVTLIERGDRVLSRAPVAVSDVVRRGLESHGVCVMTGARADRASDGGRFLRVATGSGMHRIGPVDFVLAAVGRAPAVTGLGLDAARVAYGSDGIRVDRWGRTSVPGVWALGDVTPETGRAHSAGAQGRRIVRRMIAPWAAVGGPPAIPTVVFGDPEAAWIGAIDGDRGRASWSGATEVRVEMSMTGRGMADGAVRGFATIRARGPLGKILGAAAVGSGASEIIAVVQLAMARRIPLLGLAGVPFACPGAAGIVASLANAYMRASVTRLVPCRGAGASDG